MSFKLVELPEALFHISVVDVEFHPNLNLISSATKSEPSGNMVSHSSGNAYKAIPFVVTLLATLQANCGLIAVN